MLPLNTIQQAFQQARQASMQLRKLVMGATRPSAEAVRACMEHGAQFNWMTQQGKQSTDTAISLALAKGRHEALGVILDYTGNVPAPKDKSFFDMALGTVRAPSTEKDFACCVEVLLRHGYAFGDNLASQTVLATAMDRDLSGHAAVLLSNGALSGCDDPKVAQATLKAAMDMQGGTRMLLDHASDWQKQILGKCWWECARSMHAGEDVDYIIQQGLLLGTPSLADQGYFAANQPALLHRMVENGYRIQSHGPVEAWEGEEGKMPEPFWRCNATAMVGLIEGAPDPGAFVLNHPSPRDGANWLSFMVLHNNLVEKQSWSQVDPAERVRQALPHLIAAGMDVDAVDHRGYTAGWYILLDLLENTNRHSRATVQAWLGIVRDFKLHAAPVCIGGEMVPFLEAHEGQMAQFLDRHGLLPDAQAAALERTSLPAVGKPSTRRM